MSCRLNIAPRRHGHRRSTTREVGTARRQLLPVAALLIAGAVLGGSVATSATVRGELRASFTRASVQYVELFFTAAPYPDRQGDEPVVRTPVTLVQHGPRPMTYVIVAQASTSAGAAAPPQRRTVTLAAGASVSIVLLVPLPRAAREATVAVQLAGRSEALHYRVTPAAP